MAQGRRVRRVVRRLDTYSVLRVAFLFYLSVVVMVVLAATLLWVAGGAVGAVDDAERFMRGIGFEGFRFAGFQLFQGFAFAGLVLVVVGTGLTVLAAVIYNLVSDVVGGIQLVVLEEDTTAGRQPAEPRPAPARTKARPAPARTKSRPASRVG